MGLGEKAGKKNRKKNNGRRRRKRRRGGAKEMPQRLPILGEGARFFSLMSDMTVEFPESAIDFTKEQALAALRWAARFHASSIGTLSEAVSAHSADVCDRDQGKALRGLWSRGTFWNLYRSRSQFADLERTFARELSGRLASEYPRLLKERPGIALLARRLKVAGPVLDQRLLPGLNNPSWFTILHGDLKGANFALRHNSSEGGNDCKWEAGAFDFQWSGAGLGARDVAYLVISCCCPDYVSTVEAEDELLKAYFTERCRAQRQSKSKGVEMSFRDFRLLYDVSFCDFMRWLLGYGLWGGPLEKWTLVRADDILARADGHAVGSAEDYAAAFR